MFRDFEDRYLSFGELCFGFDYCISNTSALAGLGCYNAYAVTSGQKSVQKMKGRHGKLGQESDYSSKVYTLNDESKDSSSVDEVPFSLSDPRFSFSLPSKTAKMLYPYQLEGLKWLWFLHCEGKGGILGDDMGLGKTMQICGFLAGLFHSKLIKRVLIVAPKTLLPHWIKELGMVDLSRKTGVYAGMTVKARQHELRYILQNNGVLLTTYDTVRINIKSLCDEMDKEAVIWDYMILDEGHLIKNPNTQRAKSLSEIPCAHRIIITGTPLQNKLKELWALFNFCHPGLLGDRRRFKKVYEYAILYGNEKDAPDEAKRIGSAVAQKLRDHIKPYFLRRLKKDVFCEDGSTKQAKLPKKDEIVVWLRLSRSQRQLYEGFLSPEVIRHYIPIAAITMLKKICDHPLLLTKRSAKNVVKGIKLMIKQEDHSVADNLVKHIEDFADKNDIGEHRDIRSCKISFIMSLLDNLIPEGHNVLIFSQTRLMLNLIEDNLIARGYKFLRMDGSTEASDRVKLVNDFQEGVGAPPTFLLTAKVGGLGLTLTKADRVIVVDPAWNPSIDNQSVDRAYRIGQERDVVVYRLITCGTIEEKIYRRQIFKAGLFKSATENKDHIRYYSQQDLKNLLSLPKQGFDVSLTQQQLLKEHGRDKKMDPSLKVHTKFLESLGIVGISHHSLLFSKTAPVPVSRNEDQTRIRQAAYMSSSSSCYSHKQIVDIPKDVARTKNLSLILPTNYQKQSLNKSLWCLKFMQTRQWGQGYKNMLLSRVQCSISYECSNFVYLTFVK